MQQQQIVPRCSLFDGRAQQVGGVERGQGEDGHFLQGYVKELPAQLRDSPSFREHMLRGHIAEQKQPARLDERHVAQKEGVADGDLVAARLTIARRSPIDQIGDAVLLAASDVDRVQHASQQLSAFADEGSSLFVFFAPWCFADDD